jgi:putative transposase
MVYDRKRNRSKNHDYSADGHYFVTICTQDRIKFFGEIRNGKMVLNKFGEIAEKCWQEIPSHFDNVKSDVFIIMPNHVHGIVTMRNGNASVGNADLRSLPSTRSIPDHLPEKPDRTKMTLSKIIHGFKSSTTRRINGIQNKLFFAWQKSFHDHIIHNKKELDNIRKYISENPEMHKEEKYSESVF